MAQVTCRRCGATHEVERVQQLEVRRDAPGWDGCWDVSNGLEFVWYCEDCTSVLRAAVAKLQEALGPLKLRYANLNPLCPKEES